MDIKDVTTWSDFELEDTRKYCEWALAHKDFTSVLDADGVLQEYREALYKNKLVALVRDKWTCQDCGALLSRGIGNAAVHHLDYTSDEPDNLISLCISCHGKKHGGRSKSA